MRRGTAAALAEAPQVVRAGACLRPTLAPRLRDGSARASQTGDSARALIGRSEALAVSSDRLLDRLFGATALRAAERFELGAAQADAMNVLGGVAGRCEQAPVLGAETAQILGAPAPACGPFVVVRAGDQSLCALVRGRRTAAASVGLAVVETSDRLLGLRELRIGE